MPRATHYSINLKKKPKRHLIPIYIASLLLVFHTFVVAYINSSFLKEFISEEAGVGTIYTVGSALSVLIFLFISRVLHRVGNFKLTLGLLLINFLAVVGMAFADSLRVAVPLFLVHIISVPLIIFNIDVFMEEQIGNNETTTGGKRGLLLTLTSLVGAVTPLISSLLVNGSNGTFTTVYLVSASTLIPIIILLIFFFRDFSDPEYEEIDLFSAIRTFWEQTNIRFVFLAHFTLQMFFMCMVVYAPLYLTGNIGLSWTEFGVVMLFAQMAYVILEYPIGIIADKYIGEKEMMGFGFLIIAVSISWMSFVTATSILVWSVIMFVTRVGASLVEVTTESYFFKQTKSSDAQIISFFRITRPLAYVIGALLASVALLYLPLNLLFIVFAGLMIPAMFFTLNIEDSK
ncbi:MFS transporter [Candidatus Kaiserbacteria bacterium]|nr:MFS transporter [Candidatus Kaiserbacteria bacterium]USN92000.1 MAG: MFS transporter [Candidatus Nomurabacteria bacterium]